jgi:TolA-binding protein
MREFVGFFAKLAGSAIVLVPLLFAGDEMVQLHTQVQGLTDQVSRLQRSVDEHIGVMTDLANRNVESSRTIETNADHLQSQVQQQNKTSIDSQIEKISAQVRVWQAELKDLQSRMEAATRPPVTPAMPQTQTQHAAVSQEVASQPAASRVPVASAPPVTPVSPAPPQPAETTNADLYRSAMDHYASKDFEIAATEFAKFLKLDHQSDNATNARYLLAEIEYADKDFEGALDDYTAVGPKLSDPAKSAHAQYRKALCLIEVDREDEAILELQDLKTRYPHSAEASQGARKLHALQSRGVAHP